MTQNLTSTKLSLSDTILCNHPKRKSIEEILAASIDAVNPAKLVQDTIHRTGNTLFIKDQTYNLKAFGHIYLVGAGKAGFSMAEAATQALGKYLSEGIVLVKNLPEENPTVTSVSPNEQKLAGKITIIKAGHPLPNRQSIEGSQRIFDLLSSATNKDLVICIISGGGSALMSLPANEISLADMQNLTRKLLASGATIKEINTIRKHLDFVKGGRLTQAASPATVVTLILSDVIGDPLDMIASGPTVPDPTTFQDVHDIINKYKLSTFLPASIYSYLEKGIVGSVSETPKPGDPIFEHTETFVIGNLYKAATASLEKARQEGFNTLLLTAFLSGEARYAGQFLAAILTQISRKNEPLSRPACLIAGGETTVTIHGNGLGGRNLELALGAVETLADLPDVALISFATDGDDGPTQAAGGIVTGSTFKRAMQHQIHPADFLDRNDSYHFFNKLNSLVVTGPTGTNINDLVFLFAF